MSRHRWYGATEAHFESPLEFAIAWMSKRQSDGSTKVENRDDQNAHKTDELDFLSRLNLYEFMPTSVPHETATDATIMTGIYPTPPDWFIPSSGAMTSPNDVNHIRGDGNTERGNEDAHTEPSMAQHISLKNEGRSESEQADMDVQDGLFENASGDDDLFETNGITEEDFSFFDEPDGNMNAELDPLQLSHTRQNEAKSVGHLRQTFPIISNDLAARKH